MALNRRRLFQKNSFKITTILFAALTLFSCDQLTPLKPHADYSRLIELIRLEDRTTPVYAFNDFAKRFDRASHKSTLDYLQKRKDLVKKIRNELGEHRLQWKLDDFEQRLLYVPETREEYAALYEGYCEAVIGFILDATELDNPFTNIETLDNTKPEIPQDNGVAVFLVHNLAREYVGTYAFFNENHQKEVRIALHGRIFTGEIGSYSSMLEITADGSVNFTHNRYTIWQNSAELPYNALIVPIEETLHIALRPQTEKAIRGQLSTLEKKSYRDIEKIVENWIAVEEAIVGGLVDIFFPRVVSRYIAEFPPAEIKKSVQSKFRIKKYRYLQKGIEVVRNMGSEAAIGMYRRNPRKFRDLVVTGVDGSMHL
jgi:hypothetical protein